MSLYITPSISEIDFRNNLVQLQATGEPLTPIICDNARAPQTCSDFAGDILLALCFEGDVTVLFLIPSIACPSEEALLQQCTILIEGQTCSPRGGQTISNSESCGADGCFVEMRCESTNGPICKVGDEITISCPSLEVGDCKTDAFGAE